ncbi:transposase [Micromonospora sp. FIMYZ51]|uniref:transposase n=1 Tax=Micromonospora sp. FIMYZ51 TaxID=3051832 RepID=UPI00311E7830
MSERFSWLAPMSVWPTAQELLPVQTVRPQGGGARRTDDEATFAAISFVLVTASAWRTLPRVFDVAWQTAHRRFGDWTDVDLWPRLRAATGRNASSDVRHWGEVLALAAAARATSRRQSLTDGAALDSAARRLAIRRHLPADFAERIFGPRKRA